MVTATAFNDTIEYVFSGKGRLNASESNGGPSAKQVAEERRDAEDVSVVTLVNDDIGVPHNISIFTDDSLSTELFGGELITGPSTIDYTIPPLEPGEYYFLCIVHPNMNGTVIVE